MLFIPPRHGKSELTTVRYSAWRLERQPSERIIIGAYNSVLAEKFARKCRRIVETRIPLSKDRTAVLDWETAEGGGVRAVGVGGGITGQGGNLIIIDDPVKSREEAESEAFRERCWEWYTDDLYTRLEPGGSIILIMTRWHEDDLAGRILASEDGPNWEVVKLPAIAEEDDALGRLPGAALCPERYDLDALADIKRTLGGYSFEALYQQNPTAKEGSFFKVGMLEIVDALPAGLRSCRAWDLAATEDDGDYTVGAKVSGPDTDGFWYVEDVVRGQWGAETVRRQIRQTAELDGRKVRIHLAQDPGQAGKDQARQLITLLSGFNAKSEPVTGPKEVRAVGFAAQVNAGNFKVVRGPWNKAFIEELRQFPQGTFDDQVDGGSDAFTELTTKRLIRAY